MENISKNNKIQLKIINADFCIRYTQPPADTVLNKIFEITGNAAIVLPPFLDVREFSGLPEHEREKLYLGESLEIFCLYFGKLIQSIGETEFRVPKKGI